MVLNRAFVWPLFLQSICSSSLHLGVDNNSGFTSGISARERNHHERHHQRQPRQDVTCGKCARGGVNWKERKNSANSLWDFLPATIPRVNLCETSSNSATAASEIFFPTNPLNSVTCVSNSRAFDQWCCTHEIHRWVISVPGDGLVSIQCHTVT